MDMIEKETKEEEKEEMAGSPSQVNKCPSVGGWDILQNHQSISGWNMHNPG